MSTFEPPAVNVNSPPRCAIFYYSEKAMSRYSLLPEVDNHAFYIHTYIIIQNVKLTFNKIKNEYSSKYKYERQVGYFDGKFGEWQG